MMKGLVCIFSFLYFINYGSAQIELKPTTNPIINKNHGVKLDVFGLFRGYTQIGYEKFLSPTRSIEFSLGLIGVGRNHVFEYSDTVIGAKEHNKNQFGVFLSAGYKFYRLNFLEIGRKETTPFNQGLYIKPIFYVGQYSENRIAGISYQQQTYQLQRPSTTFAAIQIELGKEWVIGNKVLIDAYGGVGYSVDNKNYYSTSYYNYKTTSAFNYCNQRIGTSPGISTTLGIKAGFLF